MQIMCIQQYFPAVVSQEKILLTCFSSIANVALYYESYNESLFNLNATGASFFFKQKIIQEILLQDSSRTTRYIHHGKMQHSHVTSTLFFDVFHIFSFLILTVFRWGWFFFDVHKDLSLKSPFSLVLLLIINCYYSNRVIQFTVRTSFEKIRSFAIQKWKHQQKRIYQSVSYGLSAI